MNLMHENGNPLEQRAFSGSHSVDPQLVGAIVERAILRLQGAERDPSALVKVSRPAPVPTPAALGHGEHDLDALASRQRDLEHQLVRTLVESPPEGLTQSPAAGLVAELRELCQARQIAQLHAQTARSAETVLMTFAVKVITEAVAAFIKDFSILLQPATGSVSWYNDTYGYVRVMTFDQNDAVRWIPYEERVVAPKQAVRLTARGQTIHIKVAKNGATYDCDKAQAYLFNGTNCYPRLS